MATVNLWVEIVRDEKSVWRHALRAGRVWKKQPDEHAGRLVKLRLEVPNRFLEVPDVSVDITIPDEPPFELRGEAEVES